MRMSATPSPSNNFARRHTYSTGMARTVNTSNVTDTPSERYGVIVASIRPYRGGWTESEEIRWAARKSGRLPRQRFAPPERPRALESAGEGGLGPARFFGV